MTHQDNNQFINKLYIKKKKKKYVCEHQRERKPKKKERKRNTRKEIKMIGSIVKISFIY